MITQNVDGLHTRAIEHIWNEKRIEERMLELHGTIYVSFVRLRLPSLLWGFVRILCASNGIQTLFEQFLVVLVLFMFPPPVIPDGVCFGTGMRYAPWTCGCRVQDQTGSIHVRKLYNCYPLRILGSPHYLKGGEQILVSLAR